LTPFYFVFVLFVIFGFTCQINDSIINLFSQWVVLFSVYSSLFLFLLLNAPFLGEKIQFYLGKSFIDRRLPGKLKGALPLTLFLITIAIICYIDTFSLYFRILDYNSISDSINQSLKSTSEKSWGNEFLKDLLDIESTVLKKLPKEFPSTGILTDFSHKVIWYLEQKKDNP
jgi:hypothetical protein